MIYTKSCSNINSRRFLFSEKVVRIAEEEQKEGGVFSRFAAALPLIGPFIGAGHQIGCYIVQYILTGMFVYTVLFDRLVDKYGVAPLLSAFIVFFIVDTFFMLWRISMPLFFLYKAYMIYASPKLFLLLYYIKPFAGDIVENSPKYYLVYVALSILVAIEQITSYTFAKKELHF